MENCSVTHPRGIIEDILVKIEKFIFHIDFVVLDIKEDEDVPIILGCPLLNIVRALVDIRESNLTLRVGNKEMTFGVKDRFKKDKAQNEVFCMDEENELEKLEN